MRRKSQPFVTAVAAVSAGLFGAGILGACAGGGMPADADQAEAGAGVGSKADGVEGADAGSGGDVAPLPTLATTYSLVMKSDIEAKEIDSGDVSSATTVVTALVTVLGSDDPALFDLEVGLCDVDLPEISGRKPTVEAAGLRKSAPASAKAQLKFVPAEVAEVGEDAEDGEDGAETAPAHFALVSERTALLLGVDPTDPNADLPDDDDDPAVVDLDEDGKPGLTIRVSGFKIYAGIRAKFGLQGVVAADGSIAGDAGLQIDMAVFGDSIPFVNAANELDEAAANTEIVSERHAFTLTPVAEPAEGAPAVSCEQLPPASSVLSPTDA